MTTRSRSRSIVSLRTVLIGMVAAAACGEKEECDGPGGLCLDLPAGTSAGAGGSQSSGSGGKTSGAAGGETGQAGEAGLGGLAEGSTGTGGTFDFGGSDGTGAGQGFSGSGGNGGKSGSGSGATGGTGGPLPQCTTLFDLESPTCPGAGGEGGTAGAGGEANDPTWCVPPPGEPVGGSGGSGGSSGGKGGSGGSAVSSTLLVDDFEDGDAYSNWLPGGRGWWQTVHDITPGTQYPEPCEAPLDGAKPTDNLAFAGGDQLAGLRSLLTYGCGYLDWGAMIQMVLNTGPECNEPFDASSYDGVRFSMQNLIPGPIRFMVGTSATVEVVNGGTCTPTPEAQCNNSHLTMVGEIGGGVMVYTVPFWTLEQEPGWGQTVPFDASKILLLQWKAGMNQEFAFAIDNVEFYRD